MYNIILKNHNGFSWFSNSNIYVKGYFFNKENTYYEKEDLISFFEEVKNETDFLKLINEINGCFTIIIKINNSLFIASDTSRVFPIFYVFKDNDIIISDDILFLKKSYNFKQIDTFSEKSLLASKYTFGDKTLLKNVYQSESNGYLHFFNGKLKKQEYFFSYAFKNKNELPFEHLKTNTVKALDNSFKRLITSIKNKQIVLPLSGGFDSRLIAVMLKKHNITNVICFTYGKKNNIELENSKKTAKRLGFKWHFIEYTNELIDGYLESDCFKNYAHYTGNHTSMPYLQDYFAVKYLKDHKLINDDAIFIPGHCGDFLGGSQYFSVFPKSLSTQDLPEFIYKKRFRHYNNTKEFKTEAILLIKEKLNKMNPQYLNHVSHSIFEDYDLKEFFTKFLINSTNVFSYFGYEHRLPYWDKELLLFFKNIPAKYKENKNLYDEVLITNYFSEYNVNFDKELTSKQVSPIISELKTRLKKHVPYSYFKNKLVKNDLLNYNYMTSIMINDMKKNNLNYNKKVTEFNERITEWYLYYSKEEL